MLATVLMMLWVVLVMVAPRVLNPRLGSDAGVMLRMILRVVLVIVAPRVLNPRLGGDAGDGADDAVGGAGDGGAADSEPAAWQRRW